MSTGLCQCGCGGITQPAPRTRTEAGWIRGEPLRFLKAHHLRLRPPEAWKNWRGGRTVVGGYVRVAAKGHPRAYGGRYALEHILVAERALGKPLPAEAVVHHVNHNPLDNRPENLVVCQDQSYHRLLHYREWRRERGLPL